jgi:hypothetical protein
MTKSTTVNRAIASAAQAADAPRRQQQKRLGKTYRTQREEENRYKVQHVNGGNMVARLANGLALWERVLITHARRSPKFQKFYGTITLLIVVSVAWLILDAHRQEVVREQQYEQPRQATQNAEAQRQAEVPEAAERPPPATPSTDRGPPAGLGSADVMTFALAPFPLGASFAPGDLGVTTTTGAGAPCAPSCAMATQSHIRPARSSQIVRRREVQRKAAIAAHQAAAGREAAAERAAVISAANLSFGNVTLRPRLTGNNALGQPHAQDQMDGLQILSGTITNHSGQTLRYLNVELTLKDCPVGYSSDECKVEISPTVDISPNQTQAFSDILGFGHLPHLDPQSQRAFSWRIVTASSCSQDDLEAHKCAKN